MSRATLLIAASALALGVACEDEPDPCVVVEGSAVTVCVVNEIGDPLTPQVVTWYRSPDDPDFDGEHNAQCEAEPCTLWSVPTAFNGVDLTGDIFVAGLYSGPPHHLDSCIYQDYQEQMVTLTPGEPVLVEIALDTTAERCEE
ncbi:MAG: hypothetical protein H6739_01135 [Alphaproteobacteria bacterium]|nr:hypothetical protein [Alphaproteobacteria bacterium]